MVITLIGYRGTGKSSVAAALGTRLRWASVDADRDIEALAGKTIQQIFADEGEPAFRALERQVMARLLTAGDRLIVAAGGGAVLDEQTRRDMRSAGPVVWLTAAVETIVQRVRADATTAQRRPDLTAQGGRTEVEQLLARREPLYRACADIVIATDDRSIDEIVADLLVQLAPHLPEGAAG